MIRLRHAADRFRAPFDSGTPKTVGFANVLGVRCIHVMLRILDDHCFRAMTSPESSRRVHRSSTSPMAEPVHTTTRRTVCCARI